MADQTSDWKRILWRERHACDDREYAQHLYYAVTDVAFDWLNRLILYKPARPYAHEVEAALHQACEIEWGGQHAWRKRLRRLDQIKEKPIPLERFVTDLQSFHWLKRFVARQSLLHRGGEAVDILATLANDRAHPLQQTALWLLESISADTTARLADETDQHACEQCLVRCGVHSIPLKWASNLPFYGCRICRRSCGLLSCPQGIVAVLDHKRAGKYELQKGVLRVNWIAHREMFDFDQVEIIQANDEEVERFAVQVGNDTDPIRQSYYQDMSCRIGPECQLSKNSIRILERTFGRVEQLHADLSRDK
jgi:hypothetical protein